MQQFDALAHAQQAKSGRAMGWIEPITIVTDTELNSAFVLPGFDHRPRGVAVLGGVGQRLLDDPVDRALELRGVPGWLAALLKRQLDRAVDPQAMTARPCAERCDGGLEVPARPTRRVGDR